MKTLPLSALRLEKLSRDHFSLLKAYSVKKIRFLLYQSVNRHFEVMVYIPPRYKLKGLKGKKTRLYKTNVAIVNEVRLKPLLGPSTENRLSVHIGRKGVCLIRETHDSQLKLDCYSFKEPSPSQEEEPLVDEAQDTLDDLESTLALREKGEVHILETKQEPNDLCFEDEEGNLIEPDLNKIVAKPKKKVTEAPKVEPDKVEPVNGPTPDGEKVEPKTNGTKHEVYMSADKRERILPAIEVGQFIKSYATLEQELAQRYDLFHTNSLQQKTKEVELIQKAYTRINEMFKSYVEKEVKQQEATHNRIFKLTSTLDKSGDTLQRIQTHNHADLEQKAKSMQVQVASTIHDLHFQLQDQWQGFFHTLQKFQRALDKLHITDPKQ
jgi:hypothetical protein